MRSGIPCEDLTLPVAARMAELVDAEGLNPSTPWVCGFDSRSGHAWVSWSHGSCVRQDDRAGRVSVPAGSVFGVIGARARRIVEP